MNKSDRERFDTAWKFVIESMFPKFLGFFYKDLFKIIDFSREIVLLPKDLLSFEKDGEVADKITDELFKVYTVDGLEQWILIHIEVQNSADENFAERMFVSYYRIFDKHGKKIISLAVLTDTNKNFRPKQYSSRICDSGVIFDFKMAKLLDYTEKELLESENPFAMVAIAHIETMKAKKDNQKKFDVKKRIAQLLAEKNFDKNTIRDVLVFMDYIIRLPKDLEIKYETEVGGDVMEVMTTWEERGMKKGMQKGIQKLYIATKNMLRENMDINLISKITGLSKKQIMDIKNGKMPK